MGLAILKPWNWILVAAIVVCSGPLTFAAICTSLFSAAVLLVVLGAILVHAFFTSVYQVFTSPSSSPSTTIHSRNGYRPAASPTPAMGPHSVSPLLVMQGSSARARGSRGSFGQRPIGGSISASSSSATSSPGKSSGGSTGGSVGSSASSMYTGQTNGGLFGGFGGFGLGSSGVVGNPGGGLGSGSSSSRSSSNSNGNGVIGNGIGNGNGSNGTGNGRRHSLIPTLGNSGGGGGALDGYYGDDDDDEEGPDDHHHHRYYYAAADDDDWPNDFAASRLLYQTAGMSPKMHRDLQNAAQPTSFAYLLNNISVRGGRPSTTTPTSGWPVASNSSRRRAASIGGMPSSMPSLVRSGTAPVRTSRSGTSTPWRRHRQPSDVGL